MLLDLPKSVAIFTGERSVLTPPPLGPVAHCMKLSNGPPVLPVPSLVTFAENEVFTDFLATVGVMADAVRSGRGRHCKALTDPGGENVKGGHGTGGLGSTPGGVF